MKLRRILLGLGMLVPVLGLLAVVGSRALPPPVSTSTIVINIMVGFFFWLFAMLVAWHGQMQRDVLLFYSMAMTLAVVVLVYRPENDLGLGTTGQLLGALLSHGLYPLTVTLLLHFSISFPDGVPAGARRLVPLLYLASVSLSAWLLATMLQVEPGGTAADLAAYQQAQRALQIYLPLVFALSPVLWAVKLTRTQDLATRKKLKWLIWGMAVGIAPHLLLYELPQGLGLAPVLPEQITVPLSIVAGASVLVAVTRYRLLDINLVINRSLVYLILSVVVVMVYLGLVALGDALLAGSRLTSSAWVRVPVVLALALLFAPARNLAQAAVDRLFFRKRHDQRLALMELSRAAARTLDIGELAGRLVELVSSVLGADKAAVFASDRDRQQLQEIVPDGTRPAATIEVAEVPGLEDSAIVYTSDDRSALAGFQVLVALQAEQRLSGMLALGPKRSGEVFDEDDLHFLDAVAAQTALAFETARAFQQLRDLNAELEQKVYERTAQLSQANDRLVEQYQQLQKLDELKETMTRMVVHDLRNPITTIALGAELALAESSSLPEEIQHSLALIQETSGHLNNMVQSMLDSARIEAGTLKIERKPVFIAGLLKDCAERLRILARAKHVDLQVEADEQLQFQLDEELVGRVVVNLLANAVRHSRPGQPIRLGARRHEPGKLEISVSNNGPVIPDEIKDRIFDKFFQASDGGKSSRQGGGLGLHFCKMVCQAHGGDISVLSPLPGKSFGARFLLTLPETS